MRERSGIPLPKPPLNILCVEPEMRDREALSAILARSSWSVETDCLRHLTIRPCVQSAIPVLRSQDTGIVICERRTTTGSWQEMLAVLECLEEPPLLIVTSRLADESLWAEALNLGAYDVLAKPYYPPEAERVLDLASSHWLHRRDRRIYRAAAS